MAKAGREDENEWYTPPEIIEAARQVLGAIDCDPASHILAQEWIQATRFYTVADDGLAQPWFGRVWLNPPFERGTLALFADKLMAELTSGNVSAAILLAHDYTDVCWFQSCARMAQAVCFASSQIRFIAPSGDKGEPRQGQALFYFGPDDGAAFVRTFSPLGLIMKATGA